jgi:tRNA(Ile)-lysidine synthase
VKRDSRRRGTSPSPIDAAVCRFLADAGIAPCRIIAAVSGGTDSSALLRALSELRGSGFDIAAAHVNHHLRGAESDGDESFVRDLCSRLGMPLHVADGALDPESIRERGIEAAARTVRYQRLTDLREKSGARFVATAHQKNDQAETVLMRLLSGSGPGGLRGIHPVREDGFIRPLLEVTREEIEVYLREHGITPRHDTSNDDPRFLRNRVRAFVRDLGATEVLASIATQARAQWPILERAIDDAEREHAEVSADETRFTSWPENEWLRGALLQRHIRRLDPGARDFDARRIVGELASIRRISVTKHFELVKRGDVLILRRNPQPIGDFEVTLTPTSPAFIPALARTIHIAFSRQPPTANRQLLQLPLDADPTFTIRNRRTGDRFHPLGLPRPKKLKDFLIDRKIPVEVRDRLPLLLWRGEIVWVPGVEISERFKVTDSAGGIYEVWMEDPGEAANDDHSGLQR